MTVHCEPWASLDRTVDASTELMTLEEAKAHLVVDTSDYDEYISACIVAARQAVEERLSRATVTQTWVMTLDQFPSDLEIRLPRPPLVSVTSVQYVDGDGTTQTWSSSNYVVSTRSLPGKIRLAYNCNWPATRYQPNAVTITYVAGYGALTAVPAPIVHAAKLILADLYSLREGSVIGTIHAENPAVDALLAPYVARFF